MNAKQLRLEIKKGNTISELAEKYEVSEDYVKEWIKRNYKHEAVNVLMELRRNENKKNKKAQSKKTEMLESIEENVSEEDIQAEEMHHENVQSIEKKSKSQILNDIQNINKKIELTKNALENSKADKEKIQLKGWKIEQESIKLFNQLEELQKRYHQNIKEINEREKNIKMLKEELAGYETNLAKLNESLEALEVISIYVHADGEIKCEGSITFEEKESWRNIYDEIRDDERYEELSIRQLKQISKLISFIQNIEKRYEIVFDIEEVQNCFDELVKKYL